jgi:DNA-binding response OmpR family regulator
MTHNALVLALTTEVSLQDEIRNLEGGADAYLRQPFLPGQLLAYIHTLSRRGLPQAVAPMSSIITVGDIRIDAVSSTVSVGGRTEYLTSIEHKLLRFLAMNANNVCSGDQIISAVWGFNNDGDTKLIKAHILHLRQKIEKNPNEPVYLLTVRGAGYSLVNRFAGESDTREVARVLQAAA